MFLNVALHIFAMLQYSYFDVALHSFFICLRCCTRSVFMLLGQGGAVGEWGDAESGVLFYSRAPDVRALGLLFFLSWCILVSIKWVVFFSILFSVFSQFFLVLVFIIGDTLSMAKRAETVADSSPCGGWTLEHDAGHLISATGASDACPPAGRAPCPTARRGVPGREATVHVPQCALEPHQGRRTVLHHVPRCRRRRVKRKAKKRTPTTGSDAGSDLTCETAGSPERSRRSDLHVRYVRDPIGGCARPLGSWAPYLMRFDYPSRAIHSIITTS
jgi:hypothetical protein